METKPFLTEIPRFRKSFPCFIRGCKNASERVIRLKHGTATIQVCLCNDCLNKPRESVLRGLGIQDPEGLQLAKKPTSISLRPWERTHAMFLGKIKQKACWIIIAAIFVGYISIKFSYVVANDSLML